MSEMTLGCTAARELAGDLIDGELPADMRAAVVSHVERCPSCPGLYRGLLAVVEALKLAGQGGSDRGDSDGAWQDSELDQDCVEEPGTEHGNPA